MDLCRCVFVAVVLGLAAPQLTGSAWAAGTFQAGEEALIAGHFEDARRAYEAAAASPGAAAKDRAAALRQLAVMAWRLRNDAALADRHLAQALGVGADLSPTHVERARFYGTVGRFDEGIAAADAAVAAASNAAERQTAALAGARAILAKLKGVPVAGQSRADVDRLARARDVIAPFSAAPPLPLDLSEALLEIALRLDDGPLALVAWRSYAREGAEAGPWAAAAAKLGAALPVWRAGNMTPRWRDEIFDGLRTSQFFELAALVAADARVAGAAKFLAEPRVAETVAYARLIEDVERATDAYYRDVANAKADVKVWHQTMRQLMAKFWDALQFPLERTRPAFADDRMAAELERRFGAYVNIGQTGGRDDMHYGHVFIDDDRTIDQYGHKASIRRIALDRMVSNGYESWMWDGRQAHGGWAKEDRVYLVRPGYVDAALVEWNRLTDPAQRAEEEGRIARLTAGDDEIAKREPAAFLPGLAARLEWAGENAIMDDVRKAGASGPELKRRFMLELDRIRLNASFYAHEGRHVLDKLAFGKKLDSEELEFRAKLSEVAFSEHARLNFGGIFNPNMGDKTSPHGRANKRVAAGLLAWMEKHRAAIAGLDPARPLMPQFDKLTDDQMRTAMRAMDPWAPKN